MLPHIDGFDVRDMVECSDCNYLFYREDAGQPLLRCANCGHVFNLTEGKGTDRKLCPECKGYGLQIQTYSCPQCNGGEDSPLVEVYVCQECYNEFRYSYDAEEHWEENEEEDEDE